MKKIINKLFATPLKASITTACIILVVIAAGTIAVSAAKSNKNSNDTAASSADADIATTTDTAADSSLSDSTADSTMDTSASASATESSSADSSARTSAANNSSSTESSSGSGNTSSSSSTGTTASTTGAVDLEAAKEIALADAQVAAADATFTKAKSDYDDGVSIYEIEFYTQTAEYEYDILASDGSILKESTKNFSGTNSSGSSSSDSYISVDEAKTIALNRAGLAASDVTFKKAALDKDDGVMVYEIEFYQGRTEYECKINAVTGAIVEYDMDTDD